MLIWYLCILVVAVVDVGGHFQQQEVLLLCWPSEAAQWVPHEVEDGCQGWGIPRGCQGCCCSVAHAVTVVVEVGPRLSSRSASTDRWVVRAALAGA